MTVPVNASIVTHFQTLEDPRIARTQKRYLLDILVIAVCTLLTGGEGFQDMELFGKSKRTWLQTFLALLNGIPSHDTFGRIMPPQHMASLRRIALNLVRREPSHPISLRPKSLLCGLDENYLLTVLSRATQDAITLPVPATGSRGVLHSALPSRSSRKKSSSSCISFSGLMSSSRRGRGASSPVAS